MGREEEVKEVLKKGRRPLRAYIYAPGNVGGLLQERGVFAVLRGGGGGGMEGRREGKDGCINGNGGTV